MTTTEDKLTVQRDEASIRVMKVGDRVWVGWANRMEVETITKVSKHQLFIGNLRYWRESLSKADQWKQKNPIQRLATPEECAEWDSNKAKIAAKRKAEQETRETQQALINDCLVRVKDRLACGILSGANAEPSMSSLAALRNLRFANWRSND